MSDWKVHLQQANRAVLLTITNNTNEQLSRGPHSVEYGTWSLFPPEKIMPGSVVEFGTHSTKILTGTGGQVCYTLGSLDFKFFWENNYWSNMNYSSSAPNKMYQIETKVSTVNSYCSLHWTINELKVKQASKSNSTIEQSKKLTPQKIDHHKSQPELIDWKSQVLSSTRAVIVTVINDSRFTLTRDSCGLQGSWAVVPPEEIAPETYVTFVSYSNSFFLGIDGKIVYNISGLKDSISFFLFNPIVGVSSYAGKTNFKQVNIKCESDNQSQANIKFTIKQCETSENTKKLRASFALMSFNTALNNTKDGSMPLRAKPLLADIIKNAGNIVCLQGLFSTKARDKFTKRFQELNYHIADSKDDPASLGSHGMLVASKFTVLKQSFLLFGNGVGKEMSVSKKGILAVKLDLSSIKPTKLLYLFVAHLQSDPSEMSDEKEVERAKETRLKQLAMCKQFIVQNIEKNVTNPQDVAVVFCGDLEVIAETDNSLNASGLKDSSNQAKETKNNKEQKEKSLSLSISLTDNAETIDLLVNHINENSPLNTVCKVFKLMNAYQVPITQFGKLRGGITKEHQKTIVLIAMGWQFMKEEITALLHNSNATRETAKKIYVDTLVYVLQLIFKSPNMIIKAPRYSEKADALCESNAFWKLIKDKILEVYSSGFTEKEKSNWNLLQRIQLFKYQIVHILENSTSLYLTSSAKARIFQETSPAITHDDILSVEVNDNTEIWSTFIQSTSASSSIKSALSVELPAGSLSRTKEYIDMMKLLGPRCTDVYRHHHPYLSGYTVVGEYNDLVVNKALKSRCDYVMTWKKLDDKYNLLPLTCDSMQVTSVKDTPDSQLSTHFSLSTVFEIL